MKHIAIFLLLAATPVAAHTLDAGTGVADITPDVKTFKVPLAGYGARMGRPAAGVHDPLHAKVLFLRDARSQVEIGNERELALITCDLRSITPELKSQVVQKTAELGFTLDNVFMCASHTHDGPSMYPEKFWQLQFGAYDPKIVDMMSTNIAKALQEAVKNAAPAKIGCGEGTIEGFTNNRRWGYDTDARKAKGETPLLSARLWAMRVDGMDGKPRAILINFASHPTILDADNMLISAEWPGVLQEQLEKAFPGAVAMFTNGGEGDQSPKDATGADAFEKVLDYGSRLTEAAKPILSGIQTREGVPIAIRRATPALPDLTFPEAAKKRFGAFLDAAMSSLPRKAEIQIIQIGDTALIGLPGEPILEVAQTVEKAVIAKGCPRAITIGLANDYIGYLVNEKEYPHGGYEVESRSYYGPTLGTFLAEQAATLAGQSPPK